MGPAEIGTLRLPDDSKNATDGSDGPGVRGLWLSNQVDLYM